MDSYSLGQLLYKAREERELTLDDARAKTRIPIATLESFEQGAFALSELSPAQIRGMLANYAVFLGLDPEQILQHYTDSQSPTRNRRRPGARPPSKSKRGSGVDVHPATSDARPPTLSSARAASGDPTHASRPETFGTRRARRSRRGRGVLNILVIVTLTAASLIVIAFIAIELLQRTPTAADDVVRDPNSGELADLPPTLTFTPRPSPTTIRTPTLEVRSQQNYQGEPVLVTVDFTQRAWVRLIVDGAELFAGLVAPGELTLEYRAVNEIILSSSNAESLVVTYNGVPQPKFGGRGQAVEVVFRPNGNVSIQTGPGFEPTENVTLTPSITPLSLAATLLAEQTPTPTDGPSPTPTLSPTASETPDVTATETTPPTETHTPTASATSTETPPPTETDTPAATPTPSAVVPPRVTPSNVTATKSP